MVDRGRRQEIGRIALLAAGCLLFALLAFPLRPSPSEGAAGRCGVTWGTYVTSGPLSSDMAPVRELDEAVGRHSQLFHWYVPWGASWGTFDYQHPLLDHIHDFASVGESGSVPLITWEPWGPPFARDGADIPLSAIASGQFDAYIDSWAAGLRDAGYPVLMDFGHEMNGSWYPWGSGVNGNTPDQYVGAFRHVHDRFVQAGVTNVRFVWNPNSFSTAIPATAFYPGDDYVDWLAIDAYNVDVAWARPYDEIAPIYSALAALNADKPMMLAEVASQASPPSGAIPVDKAAWISELAQELPRSFPRIRAVVWFNEVNTEFSLDTSSDSLAAAAAAFGSCGPPLE